MRVRTDWLPVSAALLLTGALALCLGSFLLPSSDDNVNSITVVQKHGATWMAVAVVLFLAAVFLTLGLPAVLTLFQRRGWRLGMTSAVLLAIGFLGIAGFSMLMVFLRALVESNAIAGKRLDDVVGETGLVVFLNGWIVAFYLGEVLLGIALLRARSVPRWVAVVLLLHGVLLPLSRFLPDAASKGLVLLLLVGFAGVAIHAASPENRRLHA